MRSFGISSSVSSFFFPLSYPKLPLTFHLHQNVGFRVLLSNINIQDGIEEGNSCSMSAKEKTGTRTYIGGAKKEKFDNTIFGATEEQE